LGALQDLPPYPSSFIAPPQSWTNAAGWILACCRGALLRQPALQHGATSSRTAAARILLLLTPVLGMLIIPVGLVLVLATDEVHNAVVHHPLAATMLGAGMTIWMALFLVPAKHIILRFGHRRRVTITQERVTVADESLFGSRHWSAPWRSSAASPITSAPRCRACATS
jgi:hypothetical protein